MQAFKTVQNRHSAHKKTLTSYCIASLTPNPSPLAAAHKANILLEQYNEEDQQIKKLANKIKREI